ncbi:TAR DNA-binding protein 43 [Condylostylus longicornis]|uniref:TAR DNA-binding protein 43 n=1 Tax=Condylostylus longicornis TaxID=2530218 RepID=UPI00244DA111|nr:TAR DNA-binding protein 43 [Condylostylus longicornis]XP_055385556.1 TAR DNA-binding protein 43 [Condylostylus longicornis]XP_055385557.1 TAR DNA-binding protein 43 [Condylostylus longicornis]XP_055385558.1 TAR DNA-binding protein 43 [Condylostylus longicornis]XP_055385559.1 TAR DNA-binding protein 43 [Condylostylus longicornis]XP_055385560.1 TAR DNA-binding protein 43 [Condylostylus longicornis]
MSVDYIQVIEEEGEDPIELPSEEDGTLLLSTLQAQFPGACGLKYNNAETKATRGIRLNEGRFYAPSGEGWGTISYICVFPKENKRKSDDNLENSTAKTKRIETRLRCTDLIVLGLPWKTTEQSLREHFEEFGEVLMAQIKKDVKSGQSKGFGFIRFGSYEAQMRVLATRHLIDGRWCEVKVPNSKGMAHQVPCKVFVGRCTEDLSAEDLREYFSKFGEVTDVFIPKPFRAFSFVTFLDPEVAQSLCGEDHIVKGVSVHVSNAAPKTDQNRNNNHNNYNGFNNSMMSYRGGGGGNMGGNSYGGGRSGGSNNMGSSSMSGYNNMDDRILPNSMNRGGSGGNSDMSYRGSNSGSGSGGGNYMQNPPLNNSAWSNHNRGNLDMPNLQALGINPGGQNPSNQPNNMNNPLGVGLNLNTLPMNPAIVAAALSQWGVIGNLQNQNQDPASKTFGNNSSGGPNNSNNSQNTPQNGGFLSWMNQNGNNNSSGSSNTGAGDGPQGNNQPWSRQSNGPPSQNESKPNFL